MRWCVCGLLFVACGPQGPVREETVCGENPPEVEAFVVEYAGLFDQGGDLLPGMQVSGEAFDPDGDLTQYTLEVWYDTFEDGEVDFSGPGLSYTTEVDNAVCGVTDTTVGLILVVDGNALGFETAYEVGVVLYDAEGNASNLGEPVLVNMVTPALDGT